MYLNLPTLIGFRLPHLKHHNNTIFCKEVVFKYIFFKITSKSYVLGLGNQCGTPKIVDFQWENCCSSRITTSTLISLD